MDQKQAEHLAEHIGREAPYVIASPKLSTWVGGQTWVVAVIAHATNWLLGEVESLSDWEKLKQTIQNHP